MKIRVILFSALIAFANVTLADWFDGFNNGNGSTYNNGYSNGYGYSNGQVNGGGQGTGSARGDFDVTINIKGHGNSQMNSDVSGNGLGNAQSNFYGNSYNYGNSTGYNNMNGNNVAPNFVEIQKQMELQRQQWDAYYNEMQNQSTIENNTPVQVATPKAP